MRALGYSEIDLGLPEKCTYTCAHTCAFANTSVPVERSSVTLLAASTVPAPPRPTSVHPRQVLCPASVPPKPVGVRPPLPKPVAPTAPVSKIQQPL